MVRIFQRSGKDREWVVTLETSSGGQQSHSVNAPNAVNALMRVVWMLPDEPLRQLCRATAMEKVIAVQEDAVIGIPLPPYPKRRWKLTAYSRHGVSRDLVIAEILPLALKEASALLSDEIEDVVRLTCEYDPPNGDQ